MAVAQTNSISKVADQMFMTQQAVSLNIKQLRDELVVVIDKNHYTGDLTYIKREEYFDPKKVRTIYNVVPIEEVQEDAKRA